jgi:hypothetical protein
VGGELDKFGVRVYDHRMVLRKYIRLIWVTTAVEAAAAPAR